MKDLCAILGVSRSGYYKHLKSKADHQLRCSKFYDALNYVSLVHEEHPSHGYRWVAAFIRINYGVCFSEGLIYKAFRYLDIHAETKHRKRYKPRKVKDKDPNMLFAHWDTVDRPRQVIVSDMTAFHAGDKYYELTMYFDVFTKQILSWKLSDRRGAREPYLYGLQEIVDLLEIDGPDGCPTYLHTDQGAVYASIAYEELIKDQNIVRSMSRPGTPTDNPVNESLNGWIKEELFLDFHIDTLRDRYWVRSAVSEYVDFYNAQRPCYSLNYETPDNYYALYKAGLIAKNDTFSKRFEGDQKYT